MPSRRRRRGFVLPLVLIFLLVGGALISVTLDLATQSQNSAMNMTTTQELYNAAQSGLEWGKAKLLEHREDLDWDTPKNCDVSDLSTLYATYDDFTTPHPNVWGSTDTDALNSKFANEKIKVNVEILDCNYTVTSGTPSAADNLPPVMPPQPGEGGGGKGGRESYTDGTTVIMDSYRDTSGSSGGSPSHFYVVRATATNQEKPSRHKTLETMVKVRR